MSRQRLLRRLTTAAAKWQQQQQHNALEVVKHQSCPGSLPLIRSIEQQLDHVTLPQQLHQLRLAASVLQCSRPSCSYGRMAQQRLFSSSSASSNSSDDAVGSGSAAPANSSSSSRLKDMAIMFTCAKCDTRSVKAFSRQAYERGLVLITCPGCKALHLIADHLGWFGDSSFKIDEYLAAQGQTVKRVRLDPAQQPEAAGSDQEQQVSAEDVVGWSKVQQLLSTMAAVTSGEQPNSQTDGGCCGGSSRTENSDETAAGAEHAGGSAGSQGRQVPPVGGEGVVQVSPEDVEAWKRVQEQKQHQK